MTTTGTRPRRGLRRSTLDRETAMRLAATEYERYLQQLRSLDAADWTRPTDCPAWDVRQMATHNLGMAEMVASMREFVRQNVTASRAGGGIDALTGAQVAERNGLAPADVVARYAEVIPAATRGRRRRSRLLGRLPLPEKQRVNGADELWAFGFLFDTILTRDTWMHRVDTARATRRDLDLTTDHDGVLVADVVDEWARRHGAPCRLTLTGTAGGQWTFGSGGPELTIDAVEFCRVLSGRPPATHDHHALLDTEVPF